VEFADNPVLIVLERDGHVESLHRGAWVLVQLDGSDGATIVAGAGDPGQQVFARSAMKGMQALPLIESGVVEAFDLTDAEIALACSSHSAEPQHVRLVQRMLARGHLTESALQCGASPTWHSRPNGPRRPVFHCCSGKHAGMLLSAVHAGEDSAQYLYPDSATQKVVRSTVAGMTRSELRSAIDGCNAPTFGMPLRALAAGVARLANPQRLDPERAAAARRITAAVASHPEMIGGSRLRSDTDLIKATHGRVFAKLGAEGVFVASVHGSGMGLTISIDDGNERAFHALCLDILHSHGLISHRELGSLDRWTNMAITNNAGRRTGTIQLV
jgi:L-asparaginase II